MAPNTDFFSKLFTIGFLILGLWQCAPASFQWPQSCGEGCRLEGGRRVYRYFLNPSAGQVDVLFVSDNSPSMSFDQKALAARIGHFTTILDAHEVDYRLAVTTTDIYRDQGRLVSSGGHYFVDSKLPLQERQRVFESLVVRPESLACDRLFLDYYWPPISLLQQTCGSDDERGIFAAFLNIRDYGHLWLRSQAALNVVFLSDEDVRSQLYNRTAYALAPEDYPETLIQLVHQRYPNKNFRMHAIIVLPNDVACLEAQKSQLGHRVGASYGLMYYQAAQLTQGLTMSICASDYAQLLEPLAYNVLGQFQQHKLACLDPRPVDAQTPMVQFEPSHLAIPYSLEGGWLRFHQGAARGLRVRLEYACESP